MSSIKSPGPRGHMVKVLYLWPSKRGHLCFVAHQTGPLCTVEPLYSGHALQRTPHYSGYLFKEPIISSYGQILIFRSALQRTPPYSGHLFQDPIISSYGQSLIFRTSLQRTPLYNGHLFREPIVSAIERFHFSLERGRIARRLHGQIHNSVMYCSFSFSFR